MGPRDGELEEVRYLVRVLPGQVVEQRPELSRGGLEQRDDLVGPHDGPLPPIGRVDREPVHARGQPPGHRRVPNPSGACGVGEGAVDDPQEPLRSADLMGNRAHAATSVGTRALSSEKSNTSSERSSRRTRAARAGTGEMFRMRWYPVSACQVEALRSRTPLYRSAPKVWAWPVTKMSGTGSISSPSRDWGESGVFPPYIGARCRIASIRFITSVGLA